MCLLLHHPHPRRGRGCNEENLFLPPWGPPRDGLIGKRMRPKERSRRLAWVGAIGSSRLQILRKNAVVVVVAEFARWTDEDGNQCDREEKAGTSTYLWARKGWGEDERKEKGKRLRSEEGGCVPGRWMERKA